MESSTFCKPVEEAMRVLGVRRIKDNIFNAITFYALFPIQLFFGRYVSIIYQIISREVGGAHKLYGK